MSEHGEQLHPQVLEAKGRVATVAFHFCAQRLARFIFGIYFRCYTRGRRNLPATGGAIIAPTHRSNLDTPMLGASAGRPLRYFAKSGLFRGPITTWMLVTMGAFPVRRDKIDRSALKAALAVLEAGQPLVVFPEGERKTGTRIFPLMEGVVWLSARAQVPVVPVAIGGTERAMGVGVRIPRPHKVRFVWGKPIDPPQTNDQGRLSRAALAAYSEQMRSILQAMFDEVQGELGLPIWLPES
ncbi:MAG: 1-acyl-sn-glycerol-3-phosphate acyltransferase [Acidimicrobiia bacterium]|nr:1-acyl-sn-glycerol-3-phosphate acyltransferase [Acidimicrobiia bacterium]MYC58438.1 1-acyl-sn-glycerol-3-phosphate acyltransferase [Acidimicrobiia bacterium]MYG94197.1 1-acyl-sn-glycerol-3-phosphate acyltransferase [Acidimicrobiia bacterium]MYI30456.1 1-acyl-sn-glycerol-3-phosphate acyltransferase [Acidimicrobiia bacterium]